MHKSRFPGKSVNKHPKREVSYRNLPPGFVHTDSCSPQIASEYKDSMARLVLELPELRQQFGFPMLEEFHGFRPDDGIHATCKNKCTEISSIVSTLESQKNLQLLQTTSVASSSDASKSEAEATRQTEEMQVKTEVTKNGTVTKMTKTIDEEISRQSKRRVNKRKWSVSAQTIKSLEAPSHDKKTKVVKTGNPDVCEDNSELSQKKYSPKTPVKCEPTQPTLPRATPQMMMSTITAKVTASKTVEDLPPSSSKVVEAKKMSATCTSVNQELNDTTRATSVQPVISSDFFKDKEDYASAISVFVNSKLHKIEYYESFVPESGWIQCGVCLDMTESWTLSQQKFHGIFMCFKCIDFLKRMIDTAQKDEPYSCRAKGACDIVPDEDYCEACFVRTCLLSLDLNDEMYFKMWRSVPPQARNYVPTKPPVVKRYPNRGKVLFVDFKTGAIVKICPDSITGPVKNESTVYKLCTESLQSESRELNTIKGQNTKTKNASLTSGVKEKLPKGGFKKLSQEIKDKGTTSSPNNQVRLRDKSVKVVCPLDSYEPEEEGYAVVVPEGETPPKPLCFVCGSAGIRQLIFCSGCCEPFHPYCSEDEFLLSAFIAELADENAICQSLQSSSSNSRLCKFQRWRCYRCAVCKLCSKSSSNRSSETKDNSMIKCGACLDSYHYSCARKVTSSAIGKPSDAGKWVCHNCMKCTSCGLKLSKSLQHNYRKLSTESNKSNEDREVLCLECFKRRKKGSYCPICYVCYDDNDWDTKMMECEKCNMWVHSRCEGLTDEKYSILSSLPESIPYICRLCSPFECEVGWRQAVKSEIYDGFSKVLGYFQKKSVGMSRKRRALTFDEENVSCSATTTDVYFTASDKNIQLVQDKMQAIASEVTRNDKAELSPSPSYFCTSNEKATSVSVIQVIDAENNLNQPEKLELNEVESKYIKLFEKFKIRKCVIRLEDLDRDNKHQHRKSSRRSSPRLVPPKNSCALAEDVIMESCGKIDPQDTSFERQEINQTTPTKNRERDACVDPFTKLLSFDFLTPTKLSTPTRIVVSFTDAVRRVTDRSPDNALCSVNQFYRHCMCLIPSFFQEIDSLSTERYKDFFKDAMKQVFPWFDTSQVEAETSNATNIDHFNGPVTGTDEAADGEIEEDLGQVLAEPCDETAYHDCIMFEDLYWNQQKFIDYRVCTFCAEIGDFPTYSCGRLLYAGPGDWVHVNCAIWSSEVWEEDNGGLQQTDIALARSKRTRCDYCQKFGASLNCCASSCKRCFHFLCATSAGCFLMEDKTMFCASHESNAKGSIQKDMHVTRKVFIDLEASKKKDMKFVSSNLRIFVGSMRVKHLGYIVPISAHGSKMYMLPVSYSSQRIDWAATISKGPLQLYTTQTLLNTEGDFRSYFDNFDDSKVEPFSITINHSNQKDYKASLAKFDEFLRWIEIVPVYIDEFGSSWEMPCLPYVLQSYIKGNGLMQNGLKVYFSKKIHRSKIELKVSVEDLFREPGSSEISSVTFNESNCLSSSRKIFSLVMQNPQIFSSPESFPMEYFAFMDKVGLIHPAIKYITEQLPGVESVVGKHRFRHGRPHVAAEDTPVKISESGSSRTETFRSRKPFDRFGWLASKHRHVPAPKMNFEETVKSKGLPIAMRFRNLKERSNKDLVVLSSHIHGRGLFARRDIEVGEMLIEYAGEVIRSSLCDMREKKYEDAGMGCYMFRINRDLVVDATMKGNAARFINHSCDPNCESKCVKILGKDHILIFALKNIGRGEELTYDYKFDRESDKLPCTCNSKRCRKFLN